MIIYPALDLRNRQCVRLYQGNFAQTTIYHDDPLVVAKNFIEQGAEWLHVVDLDAAKNPECHQHDFIIELVKNCGINVQVGGGIREQGQVKNLLDRNIKRVVVGSLAVKQPELVKSWLNYFGSEKIVLALDIIWQELEPYIAVHGWQSQSAKKLVDLIIYYQQNLNHVLCTDIACDGTLRGPNFKLYENLLQQFPDLAIQASGGIGSLQDLMALKKMTMPGVIVGKALYEKKFTLNEALQC